MTLPNLSVVDPSSYSNDHEIAVSHIHLDLAVDFDQKILSGSCTHKATIVSDNGASTIVFDTSYIDIGSVVHIDGTTETPLQWNLCERQGYLGSPLVVTLPNKLTKGTPVNVKINYKTTSECTGIQFLEPSQTLGKKLPYLFSQCEAIHARSIVPCQDTPNLKISYSADITTPKQFRALMSALHTGQVQQGDLMKYSFKQDTTIPSYLIAIAVGNIVGRKVGPRSTVWSEPEIIEAAAWEFDGTEEFIKTGEDLLLPYEWGVYDLLLLPASFPFGGMENPCLTFVTPSLLAGDRSLVDVVAHEIAHSWAGNLVTMKNWAHFWINEGYTMFIERKIIGRLHGEPARQFSALLGQRDLKESVKLYEETKHPEFSALVPKIEGVDPEDTFSSVPYEKGFNLLYYLEQLLGGPEVFEPYLKAHFEKFAGKSISTNDMKNFLYSFMEEKHGKSKVSILDSVDWETWFNGYGMPPVENQFDRSLEAACEELAKKWIENDDVEDGDISRFSPPQKIGFLDKLLATPPLPSNKIETLQSRYKFNEYKNCEIKFRWQSLCLQAEYEAIFPDVCQFLTEMGRMKYVRPLYRLLYKCRNGKELARKTFLENKSFYHAICQQGVSKDLELS